MDEDKKEGSTSDPLDYQFFQPSFGTLNYSFSQPSTDVLGAATPSAVAGLPVPAPPVQAVALKDFCDKAPEPLFVPSKDLCSIDAKPAAELLAPPKPQAASPQAAQPPQVEFPRPPENVLRGQSIPSPTPDYRARRSHIDAKGALLCFEGSNAQLRVIEYPDGTRAQLSYDVEGRLDSVVDRDGRTLRRVGAEKPDGFATWSMGEAESAEVKAIVHADGIFEFVSTQGLRQVTLTDGRNAMVSKPKRSADMELVLLKVFWRIDVDRSNSLSIEELNQALRQRWFAGDELEVCTLMAENFDKIKQSRRSHSNCPGIRAEDVLEYLERVKAKRKLERADCDLVPGNSPDSQVEFLPGVAVEKLYADNDNRLSIRIEAIKQGADSSPHFLAALRSLARFNPDAILAMIGRESDGFLPIRFPGCSENIVVTPADRRDSARLSRSCSYGQWVRILEKAYREYLSSYKAIDSPETAFALLTGNCQTIVASSADSNVVSELLTGTSARRPAVVTIRKERSFNVDGNIVVSGHCYGVVDIDPVTLKFTLANPWGTATSCDADGTPIKWSDGSDGTFSLSLDHLLQVAEAIHYN